MRVWLLAVAALVLVMVLVGGATRLTNPACRSHNGSRSPACCRRSSAADWRAAFDQYKQIPQYAELNPDMTLGGFKTIFWWEWSHRLLARIVGLVYVGPALWSWARGAFRGALGRPVALATALLALEPIVGWWMVSSGLSDRVEVAQERLAIHLLIAAGVFGTAIYAAVGLNARPRADAPPGFGIAAGAFALLVYVQLGLGALVAGLRAGLHLQQLAADGPELPASGSVPYAGRAVERSGDGAIRPSAGRLLRARLRPSSRLSPPSARRRTLSPGARSSSPPSPCFRSRSAS